MQEPRHACRPHEDGAAREVIRLLRSNDYVRRVSPGGGQERWVRVRSRPRRGPGGQVLWDGVTTDITLPAERALMTAPWTGNVCELRDAIPIGARIVALSDTFDALTHERPYRRAASREAAVREIHRCRGRQFDPAVVDAFVDSPAP